MYYTKVITNNLYNYTNKNYDINKLYNCLFKDTVSKIEHIILY